MQYSCNLRQSLRANYAGKAFTKKNYQGWVLGDFRMTLKYLHTNKTRTTDESENVWLAARTKTNGYGFYLGKWMWKIWITKVIFETSQLSITLLQWQDARLFFIRLFLTFWLVYQTKAFFILEMFTWETNGNFVIIIIL